MADKPMHSINACARTIGLQNVTMVSIDGDWAALPLKAL